MNKFPLTKKEILNFFNKQKKLIFSSEIINLRYSKGRILAEDLKKFKKNEIDKIVNFILSEM